MTLAMGLLFAALTTTTPPLATPVDAATEVSPRTPIFLHADAPDAVGAACVTRLREALQRSSAYRAVTDPSDARFIVGIVTMDPNEAEAGRDTGHSTVAAVTLQRETGAGLNQYVYSWVLVAKREKVDSVITDLLVAVDREIRDLEAAMRPSPRFTNGL